MHLAFPVSHLSQCFCRALLILNRSDWPTRRLSALQEFTERLQEHFCLMDEYFAPFKKYLTVLPGKSFDNVKRLKKVKKIL